MFTALYINEWREKALVFLFELGILALMLAALFVFGEKQDLQEWLLYAVLLFFFPFAALVLGAAGFEAEHRQGAWAYLFSRPVGKPVIWLTKFGALLTMFAALWLVFLAAWTAIPSIRELAIGPRLFLSYEVEPGFPWWSLWLSFFLLIVAYSLSLLHERQFNVLFVSLVLGIFIPVAAWATIVSKAGGFMSWVAPAKALRTLLICLALMALSFVGASLLALIRSDFTQPRKQTRTFVRGFVPLVFLALAGTVGSALWIPVPGERHLYSMASYGAKALYSTERGMFSYDSASGKLRWLTRKIHDVFSGSSLSGERFAYTSFDIKGRNDVALELWTCDTDGSDRKRVFGRGAEGPWSVAASLRDVMFSPDGRKIAILSNEYRGVPRNRYTIMSGLWTVNADGSGLENMPLDALLSDGPTKNLWLSFVAWGRERNALIILKRHSALPAVFSLWMYDLDSRTLSKIRDDAVPASWRMSLSPREDRLAIKYRWSPERSSTTLALLDLATLETTEIAKGEKLSLTRVQWDPTGERIAFFVKKPASGGHDDYSLVVYSLAAGKIVAEKVIGDQERDAWMYVTAWMPDGRSIVALDHEGRCLRIFDESLQETGRIDLPARITGRAAHEVVGKQILVVDEKTDTLWRYDRAKKRWKKLY